MKTWVVEYQTNYHLGVHVVNADTEQEAIELAKSCKLFGAWDGSIAYEINTKTKGVVHIGDVATLINGELVKI